MRIILLLLILGFGNGLFVAQVRAEKNPPPPPAFATLKTEAVPVKVKKVIDPLTFLAEDGALYQLAGLDIPADDDAIQTATKAVTELMDGKELKILVTKDQTRGRVTRTGHKLIHALLLKDDVWIQGRLVDEGLARVRTTAANPELAADLLAREQQAREDKKGIWDKSANSILSPDQAAPEINSFRIVEGKIVSVSTRDAEIFINFGNDWKKDFTIGVPVSLRRAFSKRFINLMTLSGKTVRVRGWLEDRNGPFITLDHPEQLEIFDNGKSLSLTPPAGGLQSTTVAKPEPPKPPEDE